MLFIMSMNFTERGIREIKDDPKRAQAAKDLAKKCGCEIKQVYLTSGKYDFMQIIETANGDRFYIVSVSKTLRSGGEALMSLTCWKIQDGALRTVEASAAAEVEA